MQSNGAENGVEAGAGGGECGSSEQSDGGVLPPTLETFLWHIKYICSHQWAVLK